MNFISSNKIKHIFKFILYKFRLFKYANHIYFLYKNRKFLKTKNTLFLLNYENLISKFSLKDIQSRIFFSTYCSNGNIYEKQLLNQLFEVSNNKGIFFDIGANIGYMTCLMARKLNCGLVVAFEMDNANYKILKRNIALNNLENVIAENVAVSDTNGEIFYHSNIVGSAVSSIEVKSSNPHTLSKVNSISLDAYVNTKKIIPTIVKIDVEGAETMVLKGMSKTLKQTNPLYLFIEIHPKDLVKFNSSKSEVEKILIENGFSLISMKENKGNEVIFAKKEHNTNLNKN